MIDWENKAIKSLVPNAQYSVNGDGIHWNIAENGGATCPTQSEIDAEVIRLQAAYDAKAYSRNRAAEYPSIADQLDDIYHNGIDAWKATIKTTKDKYPKP